MKIRLTIFAALALALLNSCGGAVKQDENGVTVKVQSPALQLYVLK